MDHGCGRNDSQITIGRFNLELPRILPEFARTEPRTTHHWRDALEHRRMARRAKRAQIKCMAHTGSLMLFQLVDRHNANGSED